MDDFLDDDLLGDDLSPHHKAHTCEVKGCDSKNNL
jgi:hypothetical protein